MAGFSGFADINKVAAVGAYIKGVREAVTDGCLSGRCVCVFLLTCEAARCLGQRHCINSLLFKRSVPQYIFSERNQQRLVALQMLISVSDVLPGGAL
jgi:hypothetical protein